MTDNSQTILVVGAAGRHAGLIVPMLAARGIRVRAFVRSEEKGAQVLERGAAEYGIGDLRDPASVARAVEGTDGIYYIAPVYPGDESQRVGTALVAAAAKAGVQKFVFSSVIHPMISALDNHIQKIPVEEAAINSGMDFTILRPCHFYQNLLHSWPEVIGSHIYAEPFSAARLLSWVDYRDVAEVGAIALTSDRLRNATFDLCADAGRDRHEVARIMSEVLGYRIEAGERDAESWLAALPLPDDGYTQDALARMYAYYDKHGLVGNPITLRAVLGREPRTMQDFLRDLVADVPTIAGQ